MREVVREVVMADPRPLRPGDPERLGEYRLLGFLGEGGQGTVYFGETRSGEPVAIKVLHARFAEHDTAERRFFNEVESARKVAEFCTARVIDADVTYERPYIVSEYVEGESLEDLVRREGPRDAGSLDRIAVGTIAALAAIHRAGIVHRDFKPGNVLLGRDGPRVIDFGIAQVVDAAGTLASRVQGTPAYMSPEQLAGTRPGPASDVFSWAVTLTFAATGRPAFGNDTIPAVMNRIMHREPELSYVPARLREVLLACLAKEAAQRPEAAQVLLALVGHEGHPDRTPTQPDVSLASSVPSPPDDGPRRRAAGALVGVVAAAAVVIAGAVTVPMWWRTTDTRSAAMASTQVAPPAASPAWSSAFGRPLGTAFKRHTGEVLSVAAGNAAPDRVVVASAGQDGRIRVSDLLTGKPYGQGSGGAKATGALRLSGLAVAEVKGRAVMVCGGYGKGLWLSDLATGRPMAAARRPGDVLALAVSTLDGRPVAIAAGYDAVRVTDLTTGRTILDHGGGAATLSVGVVRGRPVVVSAGLDGAVHVWDLATGKGVGSPYADSGAVLAAGDLDGRAVIVSSTASSTGASADPAIVVRDAVTGAIVSGPWRGHLDRISALTVTEIDGTPVVVSGSWDGTIRAWQLADGTPVGKPIESGWVSSLAVTRLGSQPVVIAGDDHGTIRAWTL